MKKLKRKPSSYMRITGGLGNQMFQYAFLYVVHRKYGLSMKLDCSSYLTEFLKGNFVHNGYELERIFNINSRTSFIKFFLSLSLICYYSSLFVSKLFKRPQKQCKNVCIEKPENYYAFQPQYLNQPYSYYHGFFQHVKYYEYYRDELINEFKFPPFDNELDIKLASKIKETESVSIHVRRGDYVGNVGFKTFGEEYYVSAVSYIEERIEKPVFYVFSDDIDWCKNNLNISRVIYVEHNYKDTAFRDMQLISLCKHHIVTNSSFSWWASWLGEQKDDSINICPKIWHRQYPEKNPSPKDWIRLT